MSAERRRQQGRMHPEQNKPSAKPAAPAAPTPPEPPKSNGAPVGRSTSSTPVGRPVGAAAPPGAPLRAPSPVHAPKPVGMQVGSTPMAGSAPVGRVVPPPGSESPVPLGEVPGGVVVSAPTEGGPQGDCSECGAKVPLGKSLCVVCSKLKGIGGSYVSPPT